MDYNVGDFIRYNNNNGYISFKKGTTEYKLTYNLNDIILMEKIINEQINGMTLIPFLPNTQVYYKDGEIYKVGVIESYENDSYIINEQSYNRKNVFNICFKENEAIENIYQDSVYNSNNNINIYKLDYTATVTGYKKNEEGVVYTLNNLSNNNDKSRVFEFNLSFLYNNELIETVNRSYQMMISPSSFPNSPQNNFESIFKLCEIGIIKNFIAPEGKKSFDDIYDKFKKINDDNTLFSEINKEKTYIISNLQLRMNNIDKKYSIIEIVEYIIIQQFLNGLNIF